MRYSKTCVKQPLSKIPKIGFQDQFNTCISLIAGQKYCRMLQGEHSVILLTFIKLFFVIKIFVLSFYEWPIYTGFTVLGRCVRQMDTKKNGDEDGCLGKPKAICPSCFMNLVTTYCPVLDLF